MGVCGGGAVGSVRTWLESELQSLFISAYFYEPCSWLRWKGCPGTQGMNVCILRVGMRACDDFHPGKTGNVILIPVVLWDFCATGKENEMFCNNSAALSTLFPFLCSPLVSLSSCFISLPIFFRNLSNSVISLSLSLLQSVSCSRQSSALVSLWRRCCQA